MKTVLLLAALVIFGCNTPIKREKPFVITYKNIVYKKGVGYYMYQDANGVEREFSDLPNAYKIGDTIR